VLANPQIARFQVAEGHVELNDTVLHVHMDDIVAQLTPGVIIGLHDGPIDTPAGAATVQAVGQIIDRARELGYCFGVVDRSGHVVADRYVSSGRPIPQGVVNRHRRAGWWRLVGMVSHERHDRLGELLAGIFLKEVSGAGDGRVCHVGGARHSGA
jgi:hypothetical protein